jgi:dihydroorotate dehydrogenase electron transfer subunit
MSSNLSTTPPSPPAASGGSAEVELDILYRAIGIGTQWLARLQPGDEVNLAGPLGQPFRMPVWDRHLAGPDVNEKDRLEAGPTQDMSVASSKPLALLIGGGIGLPPLIWLAETLRAAGVPTIAFCGARTASLLPLTLDLAVTCVADSPAMFCREFADLGVAGIPATDDGSLGVRGFIPNVLAKWLDRNPDQTRSAVVYTCGPDRMMQAVADICRQRNLSCQVCLERMMACGMGTCQSCVVRIRDDATAEGWRYRLCCTDGPVFDARDVMWA